MLSKKIKSKRIFKGYGECVIVAEYWDGMTTQEYFSSKGYDKVREKAYDSIYDRWLCNGYIEVNTKKNQIVADPYQCPSCDANPLLVKQIEIDPDVFDDVLHCDSCGKYFVIVPGDEVQQ